MLDKNNKTWYNVLVNAILNVIIFVLLFLIILYFLISPVKISGKSMENTLYDEQIVATTRFSPHSYSNGDIIIADTQRYGIVIKRVIASPGDNIAFARESENSDYINLYFFKNGKWERAEEDYIKEKMRFSSGTFSSVMVANSIDAITDEYEIELGDNEYFVMGDNRNSSADSRSIGKINKEDIISKMLFIASDNAFFSLFFNLCYKI